MESILPHAVIYLVKPVPFVKDVVFSPVYIFGFFE